MQIGFGACNAEDITAVSLWLLAKLKHKQFALNCPLLAPKVSHKDLWKQGHILLYKTLPQWGLTFITNWNIKCRKTKTRQDTVPPKEKKRKEKKNNLQNSPQCLCFFESREMRFTCFYTVQKMEPCGFLKCEFPKDVVQGEKKYHELIFLYISTVCVQIRVCWKCVNMNWRLLKAVNINKCQ